MTETQLRLLTFIKEYMAGHEGVAPNYQEMAEGVGVSSKSGIHRLVHALADQGEILIEPYKARRIRLPKQTGQEAKALARVAKITSDMMQRGAVRKGDINRLNKIACEAIRA